MQSGTRHKFYYKYQIHGAICKNIWQMFTNVWQMFVRWHASQILFSLHKFFLLFHKNTFCYFIKILFTIYKNHRAEPFTLFRNTFRNHKSQKIFLPFIKITEQNHLLFLEIINPRSQLFIEITEQNHLHFLQILFTIYWNCRKYFYHL